MKIDFTHRLYLCRTHSYILVRQGNKYGHFLTMASGSIEMVKILKDGSHYRISKRNEGEDVKEHSWVSWDLVPYPGSLDKAIEIYRRSTLARTAGARDAINELLGVVPHTPRTEKPRSELPTGHGYTIQDLANDLNLDASHLRSELRKRRIAKPGARWEWGSKIEAMKTWKGQ
jgi:hypothetical protein